MILLAVALAPVVALAVYIYWKDKFDPEPRRMLWKAFFLGVFSIIPAIILEMIAKSLGWHQSDTLWKAFVHAFIGVALIEEASKQFMVQRFILKKKYFDEPFDGITYAVMVSLGFAALENVLYSLQHGMGVAIMRAFTAVPAHTTFGIVMGYFLGMYKFSGKKRHVYMALGSATVLHGAYDFFLIQEYNRNIAFLGAVVSLIIGIWLSLKAIKLHQNNSPFNPANGG